uniref:aprataxin and PNK-like factor n=1 Tax=Jaculus jaculus TaxID=51337 RepID=UPI001E1B2E03|nr:aprataxin and PNK-like factor [Jaculus jaculus]
MDYKTQRSLSAPCAKRGDGALQRRAVRESPTSPPRELRNRGRAERGRSSEPAGPCPGVCEGGGRPAPHAEAAKMLDEDEMLNNIPKPSVVNLPNKITGSSQPQSPERTKIQSTAADGVSYLDECRDIIKEQSILGQRKRILPVWMLAENLSDPNLSAPIICGENSVIHRSGKEGICKDKAPVKIAWQGTKRLISLGNLEIIQAEQDAGKKYKTSDQEGPAITSKKVLEPFSAITLSNTDMNTMKTNTQRKDIAEEELSEVSKHEILTKGTPNKEGEAVRYESPSIVQGHSFPEESQGSHLESSSGSTSPETWHAQASDLVPGGSEGNKVKRTSCMYGVNCYRKNPVHFQHFSHPGDCDYGGSQVLDGGETDDRPECPYGVSCYRKNPQHKVEYRHSTLPEEDDGVGPPSECDLNDEECELTDEDSDWNPGKEDEEQEDVEELLQEAKKIMKGKK